jgi:hypothetical protein
MEKQRPLFKFERRAGKRDVKTERQSWSSPRKIGTNRTRHRAVEGTPERFTPWDFRFTSFGHADRD